MNDGAEIPQQIWQFWQSLLGADKRAFDLNDSASWQRLWGNLLQPNNASDEFSAVLKPWLGSMNDASSGPMFAEWMNKAFSEMLKANSASSLPPNFLPAFLSAPLGIWQNAFTDDEASFQRPWAGLLKPSELARLVDGPALGLSREWQLKWRAFSEAYKREQLASSALQRQFGALFLDATKRLYKALQIDDGEICSVRELYDLWIDIAEESYREHVMTQGYAKAFGEFINTKAATRNAWQSISNDLLAAMNLPNRRELDILIQRQHDLAAELRGSSESRANDSEIELLRAEVATLKAALETRRESGTTGNAAPPARKPRPKATRSNASSKAKPSAVKAKAKAKRVAKRAPRQANKESAEFDIAALGLDV